MRPSCAPVSRAPWRSARCPLEDVEAVINQIKHALRATGEREVNSVVLGELVMDNLKKLDKVAYVRFASVYQSFEDISEFRDAIDFLEARAAVRLTATAMPDAIACQPA